MISIFRFKSGKELRINIKRGHKIFDIPVMKRDEQVVTFAQPHDTADRYVTSMGVARFTKIGKIKETFFMEGGIEKERYVPVYEEVGKEDDEL